MKNKTLKHTCYALSAASPFYLFLSLFLFGTLHPILAQSKFPMHFALVLGSSNFSPDKSVTAIQIQPKNGLLSNLVASSGIINYRRQIQTTDLKIDQKGQTLSGEIRISPLGKQHILVIGNEKTNKNLAQYPKLLKSLRGFYFAPGYSWETIAIEYFNVSNTSSNTIESSYQIKNHGPTFRFGYQMKLALLTTGINYGLRLKKVTFEDQTSVQHHEVSTILSALNSRTIHDFRLEFGINF